MRDTTRRAAGSARGRGGAQRAIATACTSLVCLAGLLAVPGAARADGPRTLAQVQAEVARLYRQAEAATQTYDAAVEAVDKQQKSLVALGILLDRTQTRLETLKDQAGALARAQYRGLGLSEVAQLALSSDPESFLDGAGLAERGAHATQTTISELKTVTSELNGYASAATAEWESLMANQRKAADAKQQIETRLAQAKALLATLEAQEQVRLQRMEDEAAFQSQMTWLQTDAGRKVAAGTLPAGASGPAERAVAFAGRQIGKPYAWGAQGPSSYDCSGLTQRAWAAAGRSIPRTSQEQWRELPHVPVDVMRPGDLIIYFADASHVALYVGDGAIIHAPRPGRTVTMAGAGSMPILGVVRPG